MEKITIPGPGNPKPVKLAGLSVAVVLAQDFNNIEDVPKISFNQVSERYPITTGSVYPYGQCGFESLIIEGTAAAQGTTAYIAALDVCGEFNVNWGAENIKAIAGQTFSKTSTDAAQELKDLELERGGKMPKSIYIGARSNEIVYGFVDGGASPDQSGAWHVLQVDAEPLEIQGIDFIQKFKFASAAAGTAGELIISPEY